MYTESPELAMQLLNGFSTPTPAVLDSIRLQELTHFTSDNNGDRLLVKGVFEALIAFKERYKMRLLIQLELANPLTNDVLEINADTLKLTQELLDKNRFIIFFEEIDFIVDDKDNMNESLCEKIDEALDECCYITIRRTLEDISDTVTGQTKKIPEIESVGFTTKLMTNITDNMKKMIIKEMQNTI